MGRLKHPHPLIAAFLSLLFLCLSGCTALTAASAIPGALYGIVADQFSSEEVSFPNSMRATLAATQHSLQTMRLDIDILEIQSNGGYGIAFNNKELYGEITLRKHTERLTTLLLRVKTLTREESIEHAIIQLIERTLKEQTSLANFQIEAYQDLRAKPTNKAKHLGWFRPGAMLDARNSGTIGWLEVNLPSGNLAYLQGAIVPKVNTTNNINSNNDGATHDNKQQSTHG